MNARKFVTEMKKILEHNSLLRPRDRERSGMVDIKRLARFGVSDRLFRKKHIVPVVDWHISILLDGSGSMRNHDCVNGLSRAKNCVRFAIELDKAMRLIPNMNHEFIVFGATDVVIQGYGEQSDITKEYGNLFDQIPAVYRLVSDTDVIDSFDKDIEGYSQNGRDGFTSNNEDYLAVYRAFKRNLDKDNHLIIVLSDGQPSGGLIGGYDLTRSVRGDKSNLLKAIMKTCRETGSGHALTRAVSEVSKIVPVVALGIGGDHVKRYYHYHTTANDDEEMFSGIVHLIRKVIVKYG